MSLRKNQTNSGSFKKGVEPWNKGKKCDYVKQSNLQDNPAKKPEARQKMRLAKLGKGSGWIDAGGYRCKSVDGKKVFIHQDTWLKHNKRNRLPNGYIIHHKDLNRKNNNIKNLKLMLDLDHRKLHAKLQNNMIGVNRV